MGCQIVLKSQQGSTHIARLVCLRGKACLRVSHVTWPRPDLTFSQCGISAGPQDAFAHLFVKGEPTAVSLIDVTAQGLTLAQLDLIQGGNNVV